jgi:hypothetical protein
MLPKSKSPFADAFTVSVPHNCPPLPFDLKFPKRPTLFSASMDVAFMPRRTQYENLDKYQRSLCRIKG